eukprot:CAMPEP_0202695204 /NCGR_PEP_ID=MMETSP1385-20130828/8853_1 /ASSEMBLY_ACC=CAM_ASM_000861 /TAXON_ID=933848 /ORGANISM="Elphidium margaritaceum" /LENGTH=361 /DNA_ID=CAMNT_0049351185 /DNA_START=40 /DNA_END=1125 /DNA_ORIENTATION=-
MADKKQKKRQEKEFEADVRKLKEKTKSLGLALKTKEWKFGKDPQRARSNLGVRKSLHRACSHLIRQYLSHWIPNDCELQFCTSSNVDEGGNCCYDLRQYQWSEPLNFISLITDTFNVSAVSSTKQSKVTKMLARYLIDERTSNCKLQIVVNDAVINEWLLKRVKQNRVSKSMDIAQNGYRISYAPRILVEVGNGCLMEWSCPDHFIGIGFWDLVHSRTDADEDSKNDGMIDDPLVSQALHAMIHICEDLEVQKTVSISFGTTAHSPLQSIKINVINREATFNVTIYEMNVNSRLNENDDESSSMFMPIIGDLSSSKTSTNNTSNHNTNSSAKANLNKRKLSNTYNNDFPPLKKNKHENIIT